MRGIGSLSVVFACLLCAQALLPTLAHAQATLAGLARDTSGAVLPGVSVEASSPVLIEKVRAAVSDETGRYTIPNLRPGVYRVTFTLPGFKTVVREGVELVGSTVVTVNADMAVGTLEETVTVTGETPTVDLQSTTRQVSITQEIVSAIPSSRNPFSLGVLIAGVRQDFGGRDVGGAVVAEVASLVANGGRTNDQRMMVNGVALSSGIAGGWGGGAVPNATGTAEFAIDVSGVDAQAATGGVRVNFIPRDGGNRFAGTVFGSYSRGNFAGDNYTDSDVEDRGLASPNKIKANGDFNPGAGGPIVRDKVWFFLSGRYLFADNYQASVFFNANANDPNQYRYVNSGEQAILHQDQQIYQARLTWQASARNKFGATYDQENFCGCPFGLTGAGGALISPEAATDRRFPLQRFVTADWTSPVTNRLLLEVSGIHRVERWGNMHLQTGKGDNIESLTPGITSVTDNPSLATGGNFTYRSAAQFNNSWNWNIHYRAAVSYISGGHNIKVGFNNAYLHHENTTYTDPTTPYSYNFVSGNPSQIVYRIAPRTVAVNVDYDLGVFAQDRWTVGRWTLQGGVRFDTFKNHFPAQSIAPTALAPTLNVSFPKTDSLNWKDVTPKMGATYDLFGDGRTALKVTLNKYLEGLGTTGFGPAQVSDAPNPINRLNLGGPGVTFRNWSDTTGLGINNDFIPQCDLLNFAAHQECGAVVNGATFGNVTGTTVYDPDLMTGWGKRGYNWEFTAGVQHELMPRVSLSVQYARRTYGNIRIMDDTAVTSAEYQRFTMTVPTDSRLPNGGGTLTAFDLTPAGGTTAARYLVTLAENYGHQTEHFDGVNISVSARLQNGLMLQAGLGPGRQVTNDCEVVDDLPEMLHTLAGNPTRNSLFAARPLDRCEQNNGWRTGVSGLATYTIPKIDVQVSGTFQNQPGAQLDANALTAASSTTLGRGFTGAPGGRFFNIVPAGEVFIERLNQIDLRVSKLFRIGGTRTSLNFDFYNMTNSNSVLTENPTFGAAWRTPQSILLPRLFKMSAQFDF
ncbi:MAG TPA: carboxypeptidase regulatory-like domain-containing protein [Vicinamibacterales bacterium]|nr:carboxypeptidase regulatory-like domain-containing protein [Vicinamibacterales bacterium]